MKMLMCAVFDEPVGAFMQPMFFRSRGDAIRSFVHAINDGTLKQHSKDYSLFVIGEYEDATASISCPKVPERLMTGFDARSDSPE